MEASGSCSSWPAARAGLLELCYLPHGNHFGLLEHCYLPHRSRWALEIAARACCEATKPLKIPAQAGSEATKAFKIAAQACSEATKSVKIAAQACSEATKAPQSCCSGLLQGYSGAQNRWSSITAQSHCSKMLVSVTRCSVLPCYCSTLIRAWICTGSH